MRVAEKEPKKREAEFIDLKKYFENKGCKAHYTPDRLWVLVPPTQRQLYPPYFERWPDNFHYSETLREQTYAQNDAYMLDQDELSLLNDVIAEL